MLSGWLETSCSCMCVGGRLVAGVRAVAAACVSRDISFSESNQLLGMYVARCQLARVKSDAAACVSTEVRLLESSQFQLHVCPKTSGC